MNRGIGMCSMDEPQMQQPVQEVFAEVEILYTPRVKRLTTGTWQQQGLPHNSVQHGPS